MKYVRPVGGYLSAKFGLPGRLLRGNLSWRGLSVTHIVSISEKIILLTRLREKALRLADTDTSDEGCSYPPIPTGGVSVVNK